MLRQNKDPESALPYAIRLGNPGKHLYPPPLSPLPTAEYRRLLSTSPEPGRRAQLYLHLPFCETLCTFCPIHKYTLGSGGAVAEYITALKEELRNLSRLSLVRQLDFDNIYFGGGTPSVIPSDHLRDLVELICEIFALRSPQMTFEGHVRSLTRDKMRLVRKLGFNRLSTGIQTFDPRLRRLLNLTPTEEEIYNCFKVAREEGFDDFNVDLMYNLPGETPGIWEGDLRKAVALGPSSLDIYETVIDKSTPLGQQVSRGRLRIEREPEVLANSYWLAERILGDAGFHQRNLFVWEKPGYSNMLVGSQNDLRDGHTHIIGAGLSAYSLINGIPMMNEARRTEYIQRVRQTGFGAKRFHLCSTKEKMQRFMVMSLTEFTFDRDAFAKSFDLSIECVFPRQLASFMHRHLIEEAPCGYRLTRKGRAWASTMTVEFFDPSVMDEILRARMANSFIGGMTDEEEFGLPIFAVFHPELLLRGGRKIRLLAQYVGYLRRNNPGWLFEMARLFAKSLRRYGLPALIQHAWLLLECLARIVGGPIPKRDQNGRRDEAEPAISRS